jgi:two-component system, chemotaxis family, chemotaxis protein CheY
MKTLIVDDSKAMRAFLQHLAGEIGLTDLTLAEDGQHALEILVKDSSFDLALVDWDMPRMDGLSFVKAVRARPQFAGLKIMMVTTQNTLDRVTAAIEAGATDFLMKPVTRESLEDKLRVLGVVA